MTPPPLPPPPKKKKIFVTAIAILRWLVFLFFVRVLSLQFISSAKNLVLAAWRASFPSVSELISPSSGLGMLVCFFFLFFFFFTRRCRHQLLAKRDDARDAALVGKWMVLRLLYLRQRAASLHVLTRTSAAELGKNCCWCRLSFSCKMSDWSMSYFSLRSIRCFPANLLQHFLFIFRGQRRQALFFSVVPIFSYLKLSLSWGCDCCCGSYHSLNHSARLYSCFCCRWRGRCMMESWQTGKTCFLRSYLRFIVAWLSAISIPHSTHRTIYSSHMLLYILETCRGLPCKYTEHYVRVMSRRKDAHQKPKQFIVPSGDKIQKAQTLQSSYIYKFSDLPIYKKEQTTLRKGSWIYPSIHPSIHQSGVTIRYYVWSSLLVK